MEVHDSNFGNSRITVISGHYGSGKSELAVNYALHLANRFYSDNKPENYKNQNSDGESNSIMLFDLDIVNPYFRSRECKDLLENEGIHVVSSAEEFKDVDLPYMPPELTGAFQNKNIIGVLDIGGDPSGARVLARYHDEIKGLIDKGEADFWCVINANRPMTKAKEEIWKYIRDIRDTAGLQITGLVNNTHYFSETTPEDIYRGAELTEEVSHISGIPVVLNMVPEKLIGELNSDFKEKYSGRIFPIHIYLKKPWE